MRNADKAALTTRKLKKKFKEMLNSMGDSLSDLAISSNEEDGEDENNDLEDTERGKLSKVDDPGWVMGTISKSVKQ